MVSERFDKIIDIILILAGLFIAYQLLLKILGGSWQTEDLLITLLAINLGLTWRIGTKLEGHIGWHKGKDSK